MEEKPIEKKEEEKEEELNFENGSIIANKYKISAYIDEGNFGKVYKVEDINDNNKEYALKVLIKEKINEKNIEDFRKEIEILQQFTHINNKYLPKLYYYYNPPPNTLKRNYLVIDLAKRGNLFYYVKTGIFNIYKNFAKIIFKKIVQGIKNCHKANICHLDIKIENILLDENYEPIIVDFGYSKKIKNEKDEKIPIKGFIGTKYSMCPQIILDESYFGDEADIFSLGTVLFLIVNGFYGFKVAYEENKIYKYIYENDFDGYWKRIDPLGHLSDEFKKLYFKMVAFEPGERPSIDEILNSAWLKEINILEEKDNEEYKKLIKEYKKKMTETYEKIYDIEDVEAPKNSEIFIGHRALDDDSIVQFFNDETKLKKLSKNKINLNNCVKIKGYIDPVKFMNLLGTKIQQKFKKNCFIEHSEKKFKYQIIFENDEDEFEDIENENNETIIKMKLYDAGNKNYILHFIKKAGDIKEFYDYFLAIKEIIKNILN